MKELRFYSQANKLAFHSVLEAGRRAKTQGSETEDSWLLKVIKIIRVTLFS